MSTTSTETGSQPRGVKTVVGTLRRGGHVPALDGIRGIAILLVIGHHLSRSLMAEFSGTDGAVSRIFEMGWTGVDLFFVLSGFLITGILFDTKGSSNWFRSFYMRRVLRILPLYYGALLVAVIVDQIWTAEAVLGASRAGGGIWFYLTNVFAATAGWEHFGWFTHFWSLAIEEHFYLVWPLLVYALDRKQLLWASGAIVVLACAGRFAADAIGVWDGAIYFLTPFRADALAMGSLLALAVRGERGIAPLVRPAWIVGVAVAAILVAMVLTRGPLMATDRAMYTLGFSVLATGFGAFLIVGVAADADGILGRGVTHPVLRFFGKYSYGLYVLHVPIFVAFFHTDAGRALLQRFGLWSALGSSIVALTAMMTAALLSWRFWERPFLKLKRYFPSHASVRRPE